MWRDNWTEPCKQMHFGPWLIEPNWFNQAIASIKAGILRPKASDDSEVMAESVERRGYVLGGDGVAIFGLSGPMMKGSSKYGGVSTVSTRKAIRAAVRDPEVKAIMLVVDSPGGTVAGTQELADDVREANDQKPVYVHVDDLCASAAYWVASQATRVTASRTSLVGSIGTLLVVEDLSKAYADAGIQVHVISTGAFKGAGTTGAPVTDEHLAAWKNMVVGLNEHFLAGVRKGRGLSAKKLEESADGRVFLAADAMALGLVDGVMNLDEALEAPRKFKPGRDPRSSIARQATALAVSLGNLTTPSDSV